MTSTIVRIAFVIPTLLLSLRAFSQEANLEHLFKLGVRSRIIRTSTVGTLGDTNTTVVEYHYITQKAGGLRTLMIRDLPTGRDTITRLYDANYQMLRQSSRTASIVSVRHGDTLITAYASGPEQHDTTFLTKNYIRESRHAKTKIDTLPFAWSVVETFLRDDGKKLRTVGVNSFGTEPEITYEYDKKGKLIAKYRNGKPIEVRRYVQGRKVDTTYSEGKVESITEYTSNGVSATKRVFRTDGSLIFLYKLAFDKRGNEILSEHYTAEGELLTKQVTTYDKNDLVTSRRLWDHDKLVEWSTSEIKYRT